VFHRFSTGEKSSMGMRFAHRAEAELASLLDESGIRWQYEPHRFQLAQGEFVPDFFLPEIGVYVECTVARQRHVTRKNAKAREVWERYGVIVTVLYRRDFERFIEDFGVDSEALRVDVDHGRQARTTHRRRRSGQQPRRAGGNAPRLRRLGDQLRPKPPPQA
jgi:hypothetical protein